MDLEKFQNEVNEKELLALYDETAKRLLHVAMLDGHFENNDEIEWPSGNTLGEHDLYKRAEIISTIHNGIPERRVKRLADAHKHYQKTRPNYHAANRIFLQLQNQFVNNGKGNEQDFEQLYHEVYLDALGREDPIELDEGEKALVDLRVARVPLSHAQAVVEKIGPTDINEEYWLDEYSTKLDGIQRSDSLRALMTSVAEAVVDFLAAGELLAIRYNTFSNFIWLGISIWKAITDTEAATAALRANSGKKLIRIEGMLLLCKSMLLKFFQAHLEDPAQIKPREYWYGQEYSYLTRDLIDLAREIINEANRIGTTPVETPPLLSNEVNGKFLEYQHVGRKTNISNLKRKIRLLKWIMLYRSTGKKKMCLLKNKLSEGDRIKEGWKQNRDWAHKSLDIFRINVDLKIDPLFNKIAREMSLESCSKKILFLPTHQSVFDHIVLNYTLNNKEFLEAIGWTEPRACAILARSQLTAMGSWKVFGRNISPFGFTPEEVDGMMEEVDGHVVMARAADTGNPTKRFINLLNQRPGVVYPAGTTSAYSLQSLPMQHGLFSFLPSDLILIPLAFRGIHSLWPKCPKGNFQINPGSVEVVISPPMLGTTTLLPRKRALRTQLEPATLFQAIQISDLYNPEAS